MIPDFARDGSILERVYTTLRKWEGHSLYLVVDERSPNHKDHLIIESK